MTSLNQLSYPDFVALIGQENVPPGGAQTVDWWSSKAKILPTDHVLDLACTTGFSGRRIHTQTKCAVTGIDLSAAAVLEARKRAQEQFPSGKFQYVACDASSMPLESEKFSHVLGGSNFAFIQEREKALNEVCRVMIPRGIIFTSNYYYKSEPDKAVIDQVEKSLGWRPDPRWTKEFWTNFFSSRCTLIDDSVIELKMVPDAAVYAGVLEEMRRSAKVVEFSQADQKVIFERLSEVRIALNRHREFQAISLQVWEKVK